MARDGAGPVRLVTRDLERRLELVINGDGSLTAETGVSGRQLRGEAPGEVGESAELDRGSLNNGQTERTYHQGPLGAEALWTAAQLKIISLEKEAIVRPRF